MHHKNIKQSVMERKAFEHPDKTGSEKENCFYIGRFKNWNKTGGDTDDFEKEKQEVKRW